MSDLYHQVLLEELDSPHNKGILSNPDVTFHAVNASCGDDMTVYINLHENTIQEIGWVGRGCAISQATMSLLSEEIKGKSTADVLNIEQHNLETMIGVDAISPGRIKCLLLGLGAVQAALSNNQTENNSTTD